MSGAYLEVTYRKGRAIAAYYYLPRPEGKKVAKTARIESGMLVDYSKAGRPIGIEITAPSETSPQAINRILKKLGFPSLRSEELAPLQAA